MIRHAQKLFLIGAFFSVLCADANDEMRAGRDCVLRIEESIKYLMPPLESGLNIKATNSDGKEIPFASEEQKKEKIKGLFKDKTKTLLVLYSDCGIISVNEENMADIDVFKPGEYLLLVNETSKMATIHDADYSKIGITSLVLTELMLDPLGFLKKMEDTSKEKTGGVVFDDGVLNYSNDRYTYSVSMKTSLPEEIIVMNKSDGKLVSKTAFDYSDKSFIPAAVKTEYYNEKDEVVVQKSYAVKVLNSSPQRAERIFNTDSMGIYRFSDARFSPRRAYYYDGGVPSKEGAETIADAEKFGEIGRLYKNSWVDALRMNEQRSVFAKNLEAYFREYTDNALPQKSE